MWGEEGLRSKKKGEFSLCGLVRWFIFNADLTKVNLSNSNRGSKHRGESYLDRSAGFLGLWPFLSAVYSEVPVPTMPDNHGLGIKACRSGDKGTERLGCWWEKSNITRWLEERNVKEVVREVIVTIGWGGERKRGVERKNIQKKVWSSKTPGALGRVPYGQTIMRIRPGTAFLHVVLCPSPELYFSFFLFFTSESAVSSGRGISHQLSSVRKALKFK